MWFLGQGNYDAGADVGLAITAMFTIYIIGLPFAALFFAYIHRKEVTNGEKKYFDWHSYVHCTALWWFGITLYLIVAKKTPLYFLTLLSAITMMMLTIVALKYVQLPLV